MRDKDNKKIEVDLDHFFEEQVQKDAHLLEPSKSIHALDNDRVLLNEELYVIVLDQKEAYHFDDFSRRYQDYFSKFDFILGDWAFGQLRLRGFYQIGTPNVVSDQLIDSLDDYIKEYCNFGSKYFLLAKQTALDEYPERLEALFAGKLTVKEAPSGHRRTNRNRHATTSINFDRVSVNPKTRRKNKNSSSTSPSEKHTDFKISVHTHKRAAKENSRVQATKEKKSFTIHHHNKGKR